MSEVTKLFEQRIGEWLTQARKEDATFDKKVAESKKDVQGCCNYILSVVKESKQCGYDDAEIYGMARHYFDEDDIKDPGKQSVQRIIVTGHIDLTESERMEAKQQAVEEYKAELRKADAAKQAKAEQEEKERKARLLEKRKSENDGQLDLFGF